MAGAVEKCGREVAEGSLMLAPMGPWTAMSGGEAVRVKLAAGKGSVG